MALSIIMIINHAVPANGWVPKVSLEPQLMKDKQTAIHSQLRWAFIRELVEDT